MSAPVRCGRHEQGRPSRTTGLTGRGMGTGLMTIGGCTGIGPMTIGGCGGGSGCGRGRITTGGRGRQPPQRPQMTSTSPATRTTGAARTATRTIVFIAIDMIRSFHYRSSCMKATHIAFAPALRPGRVNAAQRAVARCLLGLKNTDGVQDRSSPMPPGRVGWGAGGEDRRNTGPSIERPRSRRYSWRTCAVESGPFRQADKTFSFTAQHTAASNVVQDEPTIGDAAMKLTLRKEALNDSDVFRFISRYQKTDPRRGCSRVRELARLWWRVHAPHSAPCFR